MDLINNGLMRDFAYYAVLSEMKFLALNLAVSCTRVSRGIYANYEDVETFADKKDPSKRKVITDDKKVERLRRIHMNDLEQIPTHIIVGIFYVLTKPNPEVALWHFRAFAAARFAHTFAYSMGMQPWRFFAHLVTVGTTISMGVQTLNALW